MKTLRLVQTVSLLIPVLIGYLVGWVVAPIILGFLAAWEHAEQFTIDVADKRKKRDG